MRKNITKSRRIKEFKKNTEKKFGIKWYQIDFAKLKKLSNDKLNEFFDLLNEKLNDADSWGRHVESIYWSNRDRELGIEFYEHGDYRRQFAKYVTFDSMYDENKTFSEFVIRGIRKGLFIDTSDLYL